MHPARLWTRLRDGRIRCGLCAHFCVVGESGRGRCGVRANRGGELVTLVYDTIAAINCDPVEKKPLYHFLPGSRTLSFGTMGCTMGCSFCQNAPLSQPPRLGKPPAGQAASPAALVRAAKETGSLSISYTYSEPTVFFELLCDTARLAHDQGLANIMVSNGFMSPACLDALDGMIDAANIDLKAFSPAFYGQVCQARLEPVKKNLIRMRELGWWLEVTTLVIPGLNDSAAELAALAAFLVRELGSATPWHISRFHPCHQLTDRPPTPVETLEMAWNIGREAGLDYVYVGNLPGNAHNATVCPGCQSAAVDRQGFTVSGTTLCGGTCRNCGFALPGRFTWAQSV